MPVQNGFQSHVNAQPAPGQAGDFASANPRCSTLMGAGGFVAAPEGCIVGRFAWGNPVSKLAANYFTEQSLLGFVHRENQAIIIPFLAFHELSVQEGFMMTLMSRGDFWAQFTDGAAIGDKVYANAVTGQASADVTGQGTQDIGFEGDIDTAGLLTVTTPGTGAIEVGMLVVGAGVPAGTYIVSDGNDPDTYNLSWLPAVAVVTQEFNAYGLIETPWTVATKVPVDAVVTATIDGNGVMDVTAVASGVLERGQFLSGDDVAPNTYITGQLTGALGGIGTYQTNNYVSVAETTITAMAGKLAKITTWQQAG